MNPDEMEIKDGIVVHSMTWAAADQIIYNNIGALQTSDRNTLGYYIVIWIGNAYILQGQYTCHAFDPPVLIPEGDLVFPDKFMTPMRNTSYWNHKRYEAISIMMKLKQVVMPYIEMI